MRPRILVALLFTCLAVFVAASLPTDSANAAAIPDPAVDAKPAPAQGRQSAVLAGGCFWCTEAVFERLAGVEKVTSGYAGGDGKTAHYDIVSAGRSDHAEAIEVVFDPAKISYGQILKVFFSVAHDPTQLNRQGPDWGRQYRSAIFWSDAEQKKIAEAYIEQLTAAKVFSKPIVTELNELKTFYPAERYHQDFVKRNPIHPYVVVNALPKVKKLEKEFPGLVKK
jgi:peptide-methionine (S)-S-oxide reductase